MKKENIIIGCVTIILLTGVTGCAGKFGSKSFQDKMFSYYDENNDGFVDKMEYFSISNSRFEKIDDNEDGKVTEEEAKKTFIAKRFPSKIKQWFLKSDINKDGIISSYEMKKDSKKEFLAQDINNDSKLSKNEMSEYRKNKRFQSMDLNGDGSISKDEFSNLQSSFHQ